MTSGTLSRDELGVERQAWIDAVQRLIEQARAWCAEEGWESRSSQRELNEKDLGVYSAPVLEITTPHGKLVLEPVGRLVIGAQGRVDYYAYPTMFRVKLLRKDDGWIIRTDSGLNWPQSWNRASFVEIGKGLLAAG
jgi:hypothetical protein